MESNWHEMNIQWFPGHIAKARRDILLNIKNIDIVIEVLDARAPLSTKSVFLSSLQKNKKHLLILNKSDLSDDKKNILYKNYFNKLGYYVVLLNSKSNNISKIINREILSICSDLIEKRKNKGLKINSFKTIIVGMPNVGKSTFINSYVKKNIVKVENHPGVTKKMQWVKISKDLLLLDTPGITEPKFSNQNIGFNLVLIGSLNEKNFVLDEIILYFVDFLKKNYIENLKNRYNIDVDINDTPNQIIEKIGISKNIISKNSLVDYNRVYNTILIDFRSGKLGKITIDEIY